MIRLTHDERHTLPITYVTVLLRHSEPEQGAVEYKNFDWLLSECQVGMLSLLMEYLKR